MASPSEQKLLATAHHEAGHAVAQWHYGMRFRYATVVPGEDFLGKVASGKLPAWFNPEYGTGDRILLRAQREIVVLMTGRIAEGRFRGHRARYGMESDNRGAVNLAMHLCGSKRTTEAYLQYCWCISQDLVDNHWDRIKAVAAELVVRRKLKHAEVVSIIMGMAKRKESA